MKQLLILLLTLFVFSAVSQTYPPPKYYNRFTTTPDNVSINGNTLTNVSGANISGTLTNNTTGSAATATNTWATTFPAIWALNPATWVNADAIAGTNGQPITTVPDISGNGANMTNATATPVTLLSPGQGIGGHAAINMRSNWNPITGAAPTVSYELTNSIWTPCMMTNFSATFVYRDTLELGGTSPYQVLLNTAGENIFLWIAGTNQSQYVQSYFSQANQNMEGVMLFTSAGSSENQSPTLPLFKLPVVVTYRETAGLLDIFMNGVPISFTNLDGSPATAAFSGNVFSIGNRNFQGVINPALGAFCGDISQIIVTTNSPTDQQIQSMHAELTSYYGIGGGPLLAFSGDSITAGSTAAPYTNITGIIKTMIPNSTVINMGLPGQASPNISLTVTNWAGAKINSTGVKIITLMNGVDDNLQSLTLAGWETNFINTTLNLKNQGWLVNWCTLPSFNGESNTPSRDSINTFLYANTNLFFPGKIVDYASDALMGTNGSWAVRSNLFYFGASPLGIHHTPAGDQELVTNWLYPVLQSELYGGGSGGYAASYSGNFTGSFTGNGARVTNYLAVNLTTNGANPAPAQGQVLAVQANGSIAWTNPASGGSGMTQLTGDVTAGPGSGSQVATVVQVGGYSSANVASGATAANAATTADTGSTIVMRNSSGNFSAGTISATFSGNGASLTGLNASQVTSGTLPALQLPAFSGDASSSAGSSVLTLATVGSAATSTKVTYNAKGLVTSGTTLSSGDIPTGIPAANINWPSTNAMLGAGTLNFSLAETTCFTNASFTFATPSGIQNAGYNWPVVNVTNTSGSLITIGLPANIKTTPMSGAANCTNLTTVIFHFQLGVFTNATFIPIF